MEAKEKGPDPIETVGMKTAVVGEGGETAEAEISFAVSEDWAQGGYPLRVALSVGEETVAVPLPLGVLPGIAQGVLEALRSPEIKENFRRMDEEDRDGKDACLSAILHSSVVFPEETEDEKVRGEIEERLRSFGEELSAQPEAFASGEAVLEGIRRHFRAGDSLGYLQFSLGGGRQSGSDPDSPLLSLGGYLSFGKVNVDEARVAVTRVDVYVLSPGLPLEEEALVAKLLPWLEERMEAAEKDVGRRVPVLSLPAPLSTPKLIDAPGKDEYPFILPEEAATSRKEGE